MKPGMRKRASIDQGLEGSKLSLYTNGTWPGVRIVSRLLPASLDRYLAALPAMSLIPVAPFAASRTLPV